MEQCVSLFPTSEYSSVARTNHVTLVMDTLRFPCDQEEHCHLGSMVSSLTLPSVSWGIRELRVVIQNWSPV